MISLKLDDKNNLIVDGDISIIANNEALSQDIKNIISMNKNDYIYNTDLGINYIQFLQTNDKAYLLAQLENEIYRDERVESIAITSANKRGQISLNILTQGGENVNIIMD